MKINEKMKKSIQAKTTVKRDFSKKGNKGRKKMLLIVDM